MGENDERRERPTSELGDLRRRVSALEQQNRWFKRAASLVGVVGLSALVIGATGRSSGTLEAERFVLKNAQGRTVGELFPDGLGATLRLTSSGSAVATVSTGGQVFSEASIKLSQDSSSAYLAGGVPGSDETSGAQPQLVLQTAFADSSLTSKGMGFVRTRLGGGHFDRLSSDAFLQFPDISLVLDSEGHPTLKMIDANKYASMLGSPTLTAVGTGQLLSGNAASLMLLGPGNRVIASIP